MKLLILSDSHSVMRHMERAVFDVTPDRIIHLGDVTRDAEKLREMFPRIPMTCVPGNCDHDPVTPPVQLETFGGVRVLITHGHTLGVKYGELNLLLAAQEAQARLALFGHTHRAFLDEQDGVTLLNPGAASGSYPSYAVAELENGKLSCRIVRL